MSNKLSLTSIFVGAGTTISWAATAGMAMGTHLPYEIATNPVTALPLGFAAAAACIAVGVSTATAWSSFMDSKPAPAAAPVPKNG